MFTAQYGLDLHTKFCSNSVLEYWSYISTSHIAILQVELTEDKSLIPVYKSLLLLIQIYRINANNKLPFWHNSIRKRIAEFGRNELVSVCCKSLVQSLSLSVAHGWALFTLSDIADCLLFTAVAVMIMKVIIILRIFIIIITSLNVFLLRIIQGT